METNNDFNEAARQSVKGLLSRQYYDINTGLILKNPHIGKTMIQLLNESIGLGGGHTLHPHVGDYWMIEYSPGIKLSIIKFVGDENITDKISRSTAIQIAKEWILEQKKEVQLTLFQN